MDTGLNNINNLHKKVNLPELEDVEWIIEATSEEQFNLWKENKDRYTWEQIQQGWSFTIINLKISGSLGDNKIEETLPVNISISLAKVNGHKILFYSSDSMISHYGLIDAFMISNFQRTHDSYTRWNHTNAVNFHNCVGYLDTIDQDPRDTEYESSFRDSQYIKLFKN